MSAMSRVYAKTWGEDQGIYTVSPIIEYDISQKAVAYTKPMGIYSAFIVLTALLAVFFAVSLGLALSTQYFLDWGSAVIGLIGSVGLVFVGWYSIIQIRS